MAPLSRHRTYNDAYLSPQVLYGSWPPVTTIKLGGRTLEVDRPVSVKITFLEPHEDHAFWISRKQHSERVNLGAYHRDFGDVEVAYSFSTPQTHLWFTGYSIHFESFENLSVASYNATVYIQPEHVLPHVRGKARTWNNSGETPSKHGLEKTNASTMLTPSTVASYVVQVPHHDSNSETFQYAYTAQHLNDCERQIQIRDQYSVTVGIASKSSPAPWPPVYPPPNPFSCSTHIFHNVPKRHREAVGGERHDGKTDKLPTVVPHCNEKDINSETPPSRSHPERDVNAPCSCCKRTRDAGALQAVRWAGYQRKTGLTAPTVTFMSPMDSTGGPPMYSSLPEEASYGHQRDNNSSPQPVSTVTHLVTQPPSWAAYAGF